MLSQSLQNGVRVSSTSSSSTSGLMKLMNSSSSSSTSCSSSASTSLLVSCRFKSTGSKKNLSHDQPYLQLSGIPTYHFQKSLPRLPIPPLEQTLKKYLDSTGPLLSPSEFDTTKSIVEEFSKNEGSKLHAQLLAKDTANKQTSFISEAWFDMYLRGRYPVPINSNPFLMMRDDPNPKANDQVVRASNLIVSSLRFLKSLKEEKLFPEVFFMKGEFTPAYEKFISLLPRSVSYYAAYAKDAYPLDMSQYFRLFGTSRIPQPERDALLTSSSSRHIIVMVGGRFYSVDVLSESGSAKSAREIASSLKGILEASKKSGGKAKDEDSLGLFTSEDRTVWANYREKILTSSPQNKQLLDKVDTALFVVCLDQDTPTTQEASNRLFLHGDARNRWFDKSFSILVAGNGKAAVNFEHSWGDGVAVLRYVNEIYDDSLSAPALDINSVDSSASSTPFSWSFTDDVKKGLQEAAKKIDATMSSLEFSTQLLGGVGKNTFKKANVSPDGATQMAFQLAYKRMYGTTVASYESASTSGFLHGRTETIRPASFESVAFVDAFQSTSASRETKDKTFRAAVNKHSALMKDALTGKGMDRHLFALLDLAKKSGSGSIPKIFQDKAYSVINHNILSTSTLTSKAIEGGGFGPVVEDGYGLGYGVESDFMGFNVTSYGRKTDEFVNHIKKAVIDIRDVLEGGKN